MRNMKNAVIIPALVIVGTFLVISKSQADVLATVEIYKAKIESQDGNKLKISFDIFNEQNIQPGIRYSVELDKKIDEESSIFMDQKVYSEVLTLGPGERIHKEIDYEVPSYLSGEFEVWVTSDSENGMPLGQGHAGNVTVNGSGNNVEIITDSCNVRIEGEDKTYNLFYGVDSASSEKLILSCKVKNGFSNEISATPSFDTFLRNTYGDKISSAKQGAVKLAAGEEKAIDLIIPKAEKPQAYDAVLVFLNSNDKEISNKITAHYVVQGQSASIRTINFDKNSYVKGDTAKVFFRWVGNADSFEGSRRGEIDDSYVLEITVKNESSGVCSDLHQEKIGADTPRNMNLDINIKKDCPSPVSLAVLKDENGNILDSQEYKLAGQATVDSTGKAGDGNKAGNSLIGIILGIVAFLTALSLILIVYSKFKAKKGGMNIVIFFVIMSSFLFIGAIEQASAKTISVDTQEKKKCKAQYHITNSDAEYVVGLNDDTYNYGDTMELSSRVTKKAECSNGVTRWRVRAKFDDTWGSGSYDSDGDIGLVSSYDGKATSKSKTRQVKRNPDGEPGGSPGNHYVSFVGSVYDPDGYNSGSLKTRCEAFKNGVKDDESISYKVLQPKHNVNVSVNGSGWVNGNGINCGSGRSTCSISINEGSSFTLTAHPNSDADYGSWGGACSGSDSNSCSRTMGTSDMSISASFIPKSTLMVGLNSGDGSGNIRSTNLPGIDCYSGSGYAPGCNAKFSQGADVNLQATPGAGFSNGVWESGCPGLPSQNICRMNMGGDRTATVRFNPQHRLWVGVGPNTGTENNRVASINIGGISCTSPDGGAAGCNALFNQGQVIQLRATAGPDYYGGVWGNNCAETVGDTCTLTMGGSDLVATINYKLKPNLKVTITGCGTVLAPALGWSCSSNVSCRPLYAYNTNVALTTTACPDSHFGSWSGACSGSSDCNVNMGTTDQSVIAYFAGQSNCSCDTNDCKSTCIGKACDDSCGNPTCKGTLSCPDWVEVKP